MIEPRVELVNEIVNKLRGTCTPLYVIHDELDLSLAEHSMINDQVFECSCCGWWCEIEQSSEYDSTVCEDCDESP